MELRTVWLDVGGKGGRDFLLRGRKWFMYASTRHGYAISDMLFQLRDFNCHVELTSV